MKKPLFGSLNKLSTYCSLLIDVQNINTALLRSVFTILFTSSFFLIFSPELKAQIIIEEKIEIKNNYTDQFIWPVNGCEYDHLDSTELIIQFEPPQVSSGRYTIMSLWIDSPTPYRYNEDLSLQHFSITMEPDYGEWIRDSIGVYRITIPDTVTTDSVLIVVSYENYEHACVGWGEGILNEQSGCLVCFPHSRGLFRYYASAELIIKPDSFVVTLNPPEVYPGDTVQVKIQKRNADGTLSDFPQEQTFEIAKLDGCMLGNILAEGDSGAYFYDVTQPIYFAAADSLVGDTTGTVLLRVGVVENQRSSPEHIEGLYESNTCFTGNFNSSVRKDITFEVKEPLEIIYPTLVTIERITDVPEMPTVVCKARLKKYYPGTIKYEWKYIVRKFYARRTLQKNPVCERISKSEFHGISYSSYGGEVTEWTVPFIKDSGYFYFKSLQPAKNIYDPLNHIYGCNGDTNAWYDINDEIFTGGEVLITLIAKSYQTGEVLARLDTVKLGKILGDDPGKPQIISYTNDNVIRAIQEFESRFNQFEFDANKSWPYNETGWPLYGELNEYGIMQLDSDPAATERQLWNWKANIDGGKYKFYVLIKEGDTDRFLNKYPQNVTEEMRLKCAYQKYNFYGGNFEKKERYYYRWDGKNWVENKRMPLERRKVGNQWIKKEYGTWVYEIYSEL